MSWGDLLHLALQTTFPLGINTEQISVWILYPEKTACVNQLRINLKCIQINKTLLSVPGVRSKASLCL